MTFVVGSQCDMLFLMCRVPLRIGTDLVFLTAFCCIISLLFLIRFCFFFSLLALFSHGMSLLNYRILAGRGERKSA